MKILITGGAGYLGSVMTGVLLKAGHQVTVLDNISLGIPSLLGYCSNPEFDFIRGDSRDERILKELVPGFDVIIPLAAVVGAKACDNDPVLARTVNLEAIRSLNKLRGKEQWVVSPCTNSGYGTQSGDIYCTEETPLEPISLYGETKVTAEKELLEFENSISLRLATVFGPSPRMRLDLLVNDFVYRAFKDGFIVIYERHFKRNYVHIEDVADCFLHCITNFDGMRGEPYNVGLNEANLSKAELAEKIKEYFPKFYIHYADIGSDPDKRNYIVSNDKIKAKGFEAKRSIDEGIRQLTKVYSMLPRGPFFNA